MTDWHSQKGWVWCNIELPTQWGGNNQLCHVSSLEIIDSKIQRKNRRFYRDIISQLIGLTNRDKIGDFFTNLCVFWKENQKLYNVFKNIAINRRLIDDVIGDFLKIAINHPNRADFEDMGWEWRVLLRQIKKNLSFSRDWSLLRLFWSPARSDIEWCDSFDFTASLFVQLWFWDLNPSPAWSMILFEWVRGASLLMCLASYVFT